MAGANTIWGLMAPIAKAVMAGGAVSSLLLTDFRIFGAAILFWAASLLLPAERVPRGDLLRLAGAACLGILFNQGSFITGVSLTSPGEASIITTTMPMWVMVLAAVILKDAITPRKLTGLALGAGGALILVMNSAAAGGGGGANPALGDLLVLGAQLSYALYLTLYKNFIQRYSLVTLMKWMFTFASVALLIVSAPTLASTAWSSISATEWAGAAYVVVFGTFLAYCCIMTGQKVLRPVTVGMYNYLQPIVAMCVGVAMGYDTLTLLKLLGAAMVFSGVYVVISAKPGGAHTETRA